MTAKAVIISNDRIRPSDFARNLYFPRTPLRSSFNGVDVRRRLYVFLVLFAVIAGLMFGISQIFGNGERKENMNVTNSSDTSPSANQGPIKDSSGQSGTSAKPPVNTGTSSSSSSTSITVNGQSVDIPQSGSYDKTMNLSGGNVHISGNTSQSTTGGSATNSSSTNVEINTE